ncbi:Colicin I receptor [Rhodocyclaceae bacterium]|nr:Colicin I receptor [Rhodocyclaceae bacterium]
MKRFRCPLPPYAVVLAFGLGAARAFAEGGAAVSEQDFFGEMPVVLSVSRLAQPLNETPGAVTVIDRDMIRRSGARELADVLRLVPGFLVAQRNGANPFATYHGDFDSINRRLQVFIDGRSVYSTYYAGDVHRGMMGVVLEDIERVEVLRGTNSAAYGANAFLGVINVVTRNAADSQGGMVSVTEGQGGISDNVARIGWGGDNAYFRLTTARRTDDGLDNQYDDKKVSQVHLRGDLRPSLQDEVMVQAGTIVHSAGDGFVGSTSDAARTTTWRNAYAHGAWKRQLAEGGELRFAGSYDEEIYHDAFVGGTGLVSGLVSTGGKGSRTDLEAQHSFSWGREVRMVWGGGYRREEVKSMPLFYDPNTLSSHLWRVFGNLEWRPHEKWVVNAGGMFERHSVSGARLSPRLMFNYHVTPGHTLRLGTTKSSRLPTLYEMRGDVRWYTPAVLIHQLRVTGQAKPETLVANEWGYLGEFRSLGLTVDLRGFEEKMDDGMIRRHGNARPYDLISKQPTRRRGWETQLRWQPWGGTQFLFNHTVLTVEAEQISDRRAAPTHLSTVAWFQRLPHEFDLSVIYADQGPVTMTTTTEALDASHQLDLRLARSFRVGATRCEAAVIVQAAEGGHQEFQNFKYSSRRAYATLRVDF